MLSQAILLILQLITVYCENDGIFMGNTIPHGDVEPDFRTLSPTRLNLFLPFCPFSPCNSDQFCLIGFCLPTLNVIVEHLATRSNLCVRDSECRGGTCQGSLPIGACSGPVASRNESLVEQLLEGQPCDRGACRVGFHCDPVSGRCTAGCAAPWEGCPEPNVCDSPTAGSCVPICSPGSCQPAHHCQPSTGLCVAGCAAPAEGCHSDQLCDTFGATPTCVSYCSSSADCNTNSYCNTAANSCTQRLKAGTSCSYDYQCLSSCASPYPSAASECSCSQDADCQPGFVCLGETIRFCRVQGSPSRNSLIYSIPAISIQQQYHSLASVQGRHARRHYFH